MIEKLLHKRFPIYHSRRIIFTFGNTDEILNFCAFFCKTQLQFCLKHFCRFYITLLNVPSSSKHSIRVNINLNNLPCNKKSIIFMLMGHFQFVVYKPTTIFSVLLFIYILNTANILCVTLVDVKNYMKLFLTLRIFNIFK